jgi:alcohol dehydrogenase class IV
MRFEFATATRILFGPGTAREVAPAAKEMGDRALVVTGRSPERSTSLVAELRAVGIDCRPYSVNGEPSIELVRCGVEAARADDCNLVISIGGGSAIDAGKAISALLANPGDIADYLEVIGQGKKLGSPSVPCIAVPTTSGTGAEVTRNAVLASPEHRVKISLRSPWIMPRLAVVDPELTLNLPAPVTARTGLDALTQLVEPYVSVRANPMTDVFCVAGIERVARSLRRAFHDSRDAEARTDMSLASLLSGLALANAGLGVVHGFASPVGGMFPAPHGAVCAALLPHGMATNIRALRARAPESEPLRRYQVIARLLTGNRDATAEDAIEWARQICEELGIPPLSSYGIRKDDIPLLVEKASRASSMKGNPFLLTLGELEEVLVRALG